MQSNTMAQARPLTFAVRAALTLIGFSAVIGQIVLMRELIVVFNGNEISLGIMLATWLFWTAAGSSLSSSLALGANNARRAVAALECLLAASLPPTIWALRASKTIFQTVPGELVGPLPMLLASLACLSLFCLVSGALFVVAARMAEAECAVSARAAASSAYMLEAVGSGLGGIVASMVLLRFLDSFQIATIVAILNLCMAGVLLLRVSRKQFAALALAAALIAIPLLTFVAPSLDRSSQARLWRGFHLVGSRDSIYGNLTVTGTGNLRSIYQNGVLLANAPDQNAAEEAVDYALLESPAPRRVLLIGGGVNGSIAEALKHPTVERIDTVELDPALIDMARQFFPAQFAPLVSDPRVHMHYADGRYYLRTTGDRFDVIILNVPDPQTAQINRFYTAEFFRSARDHLAPGGLLALQLRSSEETISPDLADFLRCIRRTLEEVFPTIVAIPGDTIHFFAATRPDVLTADPQTLIARLNERNLQPQYVREYFIPFRMMPDRMAQVRRTTAAAGFDAGQSRFRADRLLFRRCVVEHAIQGGPFQLVQERGARRFYARPGCGRCSVVACGDPSGVCGHSRETCPERRGLLRGHNRLHTDRAADCSAAGVPVHLWLRLLPARDSDRPVHVGHCVWELAEYPPHTSQ